MPEGLSRVCKRLEDVVRTCGLDQLVVSSNRRKPPDTEWKTWASLATSERGARLLRTATFVKIDLYYKGNESRQLHWKASAYLWCAL